jgi:hypothetical protein
MGLLRALDLFRQPVRSCALGFFGSQFRFLKTGYRFWLKGPNDCRVK